ncbi:MAG: PspC domain-containing protein [Propionibacteriaceae bacterium]|jgi:phage shock protein PspC (stress-responsive transcriptional regulator)|nr:PspC domain-containing protein [Propionibacteriaceae bacterium]
MSTRQLARSKTNRVLGGVAGGIAEFTGLDSGLVRLITAAIVLFTGVGLVGYILAWILLPEEGSSSSGLTSIISAFRGNSTTPDSNPHPDDYR